MKPDLVFPYGDPDLDGVLKSNPEDFQVDEQLGFEPDDEGEHLLLWIEKRNLSTGELVERVARDWSLRRRDIGYCGLKDKNAQTRQWLSLHLPGKPVPAAVDANGAYRVLEQRRHRRKLRPGSHRANRFRVRLRQVPEPGAASLNRIERVASAGFANYFGEQRFGRNQDNVAQALLRLGDKRLSRSRRSLLISALRSHVFNQILCRRVEEDYWREPLEGDVFMLRGSRSIFSAAIDSEIRRRFDLLDISSCASLYGQGDSPLAGKAARLEAEVLAEQGEVIHCLDGLGVKRQMRPLRAIPGEFDFDYHADEQTLKLDFSLPPGTYATSLIRHFCRYREKI